MATERSKFWPGFDEAFRTGRYMKPNPEVHGLTVASVMLNMMFGDQLLAKGTGWFWRTPHGIALVTAWHNLSGLHHTKRTALSKTGGLPDRVRYRYMTRSPQTFQEAEVPLFLDDERTQPRWFVHSVCGSYFDFAFILLDITGAEVGCINDTVPISSDPLRPGEDVFAVGFPQGVGTLQIFSVWKRGSVASDPDVLTDGHPKFYVDMAGRGGLSGAPVYRMQRGFVTSQTPSGQSFGLGDKTEFVGIYTGRAADQLPADARSGESSDLGFVWRAEVVQEMIAGGTLDEQPEIGKGEIRFEEIWKMPSPAEQT